MGYVYFYYDTKRKKTDYAGITNSIYRRTKEHRWYESWVTDDHVVCYIKLSDEYLTAAEYVFINELKPTRNIMKRKVPKKLEGYSTDWETLKSQVKIFEKDLRFADIFS